MAVQAENIQRIALVGTGLIGSSWAAFLAGRRLSVTLFDPEPSSRALGLERARVGLAFLKAHNLIAPVDGPDTPSPFRVAESLTDAVADAQLVIESAPENYETKVPLFTELDRLTQPSCVLASSSSGLLMTRIQQQMQHPDRALIAHPFNPVHLIPLVELVGGESTGPQVLVRMQAFFESLGKAAVILKKEVPGHIGNRLQAAVWREAIQLVLDGVGSVEDVDRALCNGPGPRWALMGQHMIFHLGGGQGGIAAFMDHIGQSWQALWDDMADWTSIPAEAKAALAAGVEEELHGRSAAELQRWRDSQLAQRSQSKES